MEPATCNEITEKRGKEYSTLPNCLITLVYMRPPKGTRSGINSHLMDRLASLTLFYNNVTFA
jgi:hypothetical protein